MIKTFIVALAFIFIATAAFAAAPESGIGVNLGSIRDWSRSQAFIDAFRSSRQWIPQGFRLPWGQGAPLDLGPMGWVRSLQPDQYAGTLMFRDTDDYPAGIYDVTYSGEGTMIFRFDATVVSSNPGHYELDVIPQQGGIYLEIRTINPDNPIRDIQVRWRGHDNETTQWNPRYLEFLKGFKVFRFMDWGSTNFNNLEEWADRTTPAHSSQSALQARQKGVALEFMIDFANVTGVNPWFTVPERASDDYIFKMAQLIKAQLNPNKLVYIEYSNECWNGLFTCRDYATEQATALGLQRWHDFYAARSKAIFDIFEVELGLNRIVRVISGQSANPWHGEQILTALNALGGQADAYGIAPYFGLDGRNSLLDPMDDLDEIFSLLQARLDPDAPLTERSTTRSIVNNQTMADEHGLVLIAYEAGQHMTGRTAAGLVFCGPANRDPRMGDLYDEYLDFWSATTGNNLMMHFADMSRFSQSGCWGLADSYQSNYSKEAAIRARLDAPEPPNVPSNIVVVVGQRTTTVTWADNSDNETGFEIERQSKHKKHNDWLPSQIIVVGPDVVSYTERVRRKIRRYRVRAVNSIGPSVWSAWVQ